MQIIQTHYKNLSFESGGYNGGKINCSKSPFAGQKIWQTGTREAKQNGKNYGGPPSLESSEPKGEN